MSTTTLENWRPRTIKQGEWKNEFVLTDSCDRDSLHKYTHKRSQWFCFYIHDKVGCQENRMKKWTDTCFTVLHDYMVVPNPYDDLYVETIAAVVGNTETNEFFELWREEQNNGNKKIVFYG